MKPFTLAAATALTVSLLTCTVPASPTEAAPTRAAPASGPAAPHAAAVSPGSIQYVHSTLHGTPGGRILGTVACPTGTVVVMAAASGNGYLDSLTPLRGARTSDRISNFTSVGMTAGFSPVQPPGSATMDVVAGCAPAAQLAGATSVSTKVRVSSTGFSEAVASCPAGMRAFGGGGHFISADNRYSTRESAMYSNSVTHDGTGWYFRGWSISTLNSLVVTTSCAPLPGSYIASKRVAYTPFDTIVFAQCAFGYFPLSGGEQILSTDGGTGLDLVGSIQFSVPTNNGWYVDGASGGGPHHLVLDSLVQCVPGG